MAVSFGKEKTINNQAKSLKTYLDLIWSRPSELQVVRKEIDPSKFEVTAILEHLDRRKQFPAVYFQNPLNMHSELADFPLVSNLWATRERCAEMLGLPREVAGRDLGPRFAEMGETPREPVIVSNDNAPVQAHVYEGDKADMWMFPVVKHFEMDLCPVLTMANIMHEPGEQNYNVTFVKTFPETGNRGGVTIHGKDMGRMTRVWAQRGEPIPTVCVLGHHPAFWLGSIALTPYGTNEYATIGGYLQEPVRLAPSVTWGREFLVPADAEIIIEGTLHPDERTVVDPFGEVSRLYQPQELAPVMKVTAITHRTDAIFQDVFSGHREHFLLGLIPREGSILNYLSARHGGVTAVALPTSGYGRAICYVSIRKRESGQAKQIALSALAHSGVQTVVVVDDDIDVFNEEDVIWAVSTYTNPSRDIDMVKNVGRPGDRAADNDRVIIDATRPTNIAFFSRLRVPPQAMEEMRIEDWLEPGGEPGAPG